MNTSFSERREALIGRLPELKLDSFVVTALPNIRYLTGFTGSNGVLLVTPQASRLFTDPRYTTQAARECDVPATTVKGPLFRKVAGSMRLLRSAGFERGRISYSFWESLERELPATTKLVPVGGWIEEQRTVKDAAEIERIRRAVRTADRAFRKTLARIRVGISEAEVAAELDHQMRRFGAEAPAFETIVAAGRRAALPHARPTAERLKADQLLLIDMGAAQEGYMSDMTRVVAIGSPGASLQKLYNAVLEAQLAAIDVVRDGVAAAAVDRAARRVLRGHRLDKAFVHSTGHGLGLEIHEPPRIGKGDKTRLRAGMVITIEPGAYLASKGGVRIEDTVLVTANGCEILTPTAKELVAV